MSRFYQRIAFLTKDTKTNKYNNKTETFPKRKKKSQGRVIEEDTYIFTCKLQSEILFRNCWNGFTNVVI